MHIHWASQNGYRDIVRILLEHGADANARDGNGWTPLVPRASQKGFSKVACVLLGQGGGCERPGLQQVDFTTSCIAKKCGEVARILLEHCGDATTGLPYIGHPKKDI